MVRYPDWVCDECGREHGKRPKGNPYGATYHYGICDLCGHNTDVTEPRDWGHLRDSWKTTKHELL